MSQIQTWVESFNFTKEQIEQWEQQLPKGKSVIRWVLENNKIPAETFLLWAKKNYQLPVLKDTFSDFKNVAEIKTRYSNIWPDHVTPIADWDGTLFLACLEPVADFQSPQNHQWVLASLSLILKLRGETEVALPKTDAPLPDAPAGLKLDAITPVSFGNLSLDAPAGLTLAPPKFEAPKSEALDAKTRIIDAPSGLNFNFDVPPSISAAASLPPPTAHMTEDGIRGFEDVGQYLLSEMSQYFEHSMILLFNQDRLEPWKWTPNWTRNNSRSSGIDLSGASIFRIVHETKNSYHGHIVPNPINEAFFEAWSAGKYPEHITVSPILIGKNLSGMILGTTQKAEGSALSLKKIERLGEKAGELLIKWGPSKAA